MNLSIAQTNPPALETRFLPPPNWRWHRFQTAQGRNIRFGTAAPQSPVPSAIIIGLQGLSEYTEKYFELANNLVDHNLSFWMMDWQGQGRSDRYLKNPYKRHVTSFQQDVEDLHYFIMEYVKHAAVHPDVGRIPLVMLGHSMGANIGLHYLKKYPDIFSCAAFSAPMVGIQAMNRTPFAPLAARFMNFMAPSCYVPGGKDWNKEMRTDDFEDWFSSDPIRKEIHNAWMVADPALQIGNVTCKWLYEALQSAKRLQRDNVAQSIDIPCLFGLAENKNLVDNDAARAFASQMKNAQIIDFPTSKHEILMENDDIRSAFLNAILKMLETNNIQEQLKPF
jgi:lysophospholipase